jgi:hypothetical protein
MHIQHIRRNGLPGVLQLIQEIQDCVPDSLPGLCEGLTIREAPGKSWDFRQDYILGLPVDHGIAFNVVHATSLQDRGSSAHRSTHTMRGLYIPQPLPYSFPS